MSKATVSFDMPFEEYWKSIGLSPSQLVNLLISARHYMWRKNEPMDDKDILRLGRLFHTKILEPHKYEDEYVVWEGGKRDKRIKKYAAFLDEHEGKTILTPKLVAEATAMVAAVEQHPMASRLLWGGKGPDETRNPEVSLFWKDERTGLKCKGRPDMIIPNIKKPCAVDLKTTANPIPYAFGSIAAKLGYHIKAAHYQAGWEQLTGELLDIYFVAVQSQAPHDVVVYRVDELSMTTGMQKCYEAMDRFMECTESDEWPGYSNDIEPLQLPGWATQGPEPVFDGEVIYE